MNSDRIDRASRLVGIPPGDLLRKSRISPRSMAMIKAGRRQLSVLQMERLSDATGLGPSFFLEEEEPKVTRARFRHDMSQVPIDETDELTYWRAREIFRLSAIADLMAEIIPQPLKNKARAIRERVQAHPKIDGPTLADALGLGAARPPIGPQLLRVLEESGFCVVYQMFPWQAHTAGVSWWHSGAPFVAIGAALGDARAHFTLAHELGHLLMEPETDAPAPFVCTVDLKPTPSGVAAERKCNQIAAQILMPEALREEAAARIHGSSPGSLVSKLSREWGVSLQAAALRLKGWGFLNDRQISMFFKPSTGGGGFAGKHSSERFGDKHRTLEIVRALHESGASARYISWAAKIPYESVIAALKPADANSV